MTLATTEAGALAPMQSQLPTIQQAPAAVVQIHEWAAELSAAHQLASALAHSSFLPMALRQKGKGHFKNIDELTNDAAAVILAGKSVGMDPMQAVQNIFPVHGMPSMYARSMAALVMAQGHELVRGDATDESVTWYSRRKGQTERQSFTWTIQRATKAGYTSNAKYKSDPIGMLSAKALAEACRVGFPDVLLGMAYSVEDLELDPDVTATEDAPAAEPEKPKTKVTRKARAPRKPAANAAPDPEKPAVVDTPVDEGDEAPMEEPAAEVQMVTPETWGQIRQAMNEQGIGKPSDQQSAVAEIVGRQIGNPLTELTDEEATKVLAAFDPTIHQAGLPIDGEG